MEERKEAHLKIIHSINKNVEIDVHLEDTTHQLKDKVAAKLQLDPEAIKLIFKGKALDLEATLEDSGITNNSTLHMIINKEATKSSPQAVGQPAPAETKSALPQNLSTGGFGMMNQLGYSSAGVNPSQVQDFMNNPFVKTMMNQMLSNPQLIEKMAENDPMLRGMLESNPEIKDMIGTETMKQMFNDPQAVASALGMMNRMKSNPITTMQGASFPKPGGNTEEGKDETKTGAPAQPAGNAPAPGTQAQPANPFAALMGGLGGGAGGLPGGLTNPLLQNSTNTQLPPNMFNMLLQNRMADRGLVPPPAGQAAQGAGGAPVNPFLSFMSQLQQQQQGQQAGGQGVAIGTNQPAGQSNGPVNYEEKYKGLLAEMEDMGFSDKKANLDALIATSGDLAKAIDKVAEQKDDLYD